MTLSDYIFLALFNNWIFLTSMASKKFVKLSLELLFLLSVLSPLAGNPLKGKFHPIGPGTDAGLYNEGFFEGDIVPRMDVSIKDPVRPGFEFHLLHRTEGEFLICRTLNYTHDRTVQERRDLKYKTPEQCSKTGTKLLTNTGEWVSLN